MGACYGDGILGFIPGGIEGAEAQHDFVKSFAALGLSHRFNEVIGDRVAEFAFKKGEVVTRWLSPEEAAPVLSAARNAGGSAPYSMFPGCLENQLYIPGCRSSGEGRVKMPGSPLDGWSFRPMRSAVAGLEAWVDLIQKGEVEDNLDFTRRLLESMKLCSEHRLLFTIGY
ncbi:MAG: hypothetical protein U0359_31765 [Byssovorax sp.]